MPQKYRMIVSCAPEPSETVLASTEYVSLDGSLHLQRVEAFDRRADKLEVVWIDGDYTCRIDLVKLVDAIALATFNNEVEHAQKTVRVVDFAQFEHTER